MSKRGSKRRKRRGFGANEIINSAISEGIGEIMENHPQFKQHQEYILRHLDYNKLNEKIEDVYEHIEKKGKRWPDEKKAEYLHKEISDYVATGAVFDEAGKEIILKGSLEEKAKSGSLFDILSLRRRKARNNLEGEKYLNDTLRAFQDLYTLFKTGDYAKRMPEVAEAVSTVYDMGFLDPAVDVLKYYGLIKDKRQYDALKNAIIERTRESREKVVSGIEAYATGQAYKKAAAFIFGIAGILALLASGAGITGGVIGNLSNSTAGLIGVGLIITSLALFMLKKKK